MAEHQQTSDNRHHLAIWCRAEVFTFGALTTPPPPDITSTVNFRSMTLFLIDVVFLEFKIYCEIYEKKWDCRLSKNEVRTISIAI